MKKELSAEVIPVVDKAKKLLFSEWIGVFTSRIVTDHPGNPAAQLADLQDKKRLLRERITNAEPVISGYGTGIRYSIPEGGEVWVASQMAAIGLREDSVTHFVTLGGHRFMEDLQTRQGVDLGIVAEPEFTDEELSLALVELPLDPLTIGKPAGKISPQVKYF